MNHEEGTCEGVCICIYAYTLACECLYMHISMYT